MKKKLAEMTFREMWEEAERKGVDKKILEENKRFIMALLQREGFSDQQIYEMKMVKVWPLFWDSFGVLGDQLITLLNMGLERRPEMGPLMNELLKPLNDTLEKNIEKLEKELEKKRDKSNH